MADVTFNTASGLTVARELMIAYLNTGTEASPVWSPLGKRVEESSMEMDWEKDSIKDILGNTFTTLKKPIVTQTFDSFPLDSSEDALTYIWNRAVVDRDAQTLANLDMMIVHQYAGTATTAVWAERYAACAIEMTSLGGEGGGNMETSIDVTYGGTRTVGTAAVSGATVTFTAA